MTPLIRPSATFSPQAGRRISREIPRPAKRGEGAAKRRGRGRGIATPSGRRAVVDVTPDLLDQPHDVERFLHGVVRTDRRDVRARQALAAENEDRELVTVGLATQA